MTETMTVMLSCPGTAKASLQSIWIATTREKYWEMLEVLPPAAMRNGAFMVGEAMDHHKGSPRFSCFKQVGEQYFELSQPITMKRFQELFGKTSYREQLKELENKTAEAVY